MRPRWGFFGATRSETHVHFREFGRDTSGLGEEAVAVVALDGVGEDSLAVAVGDEGMRRRLEMEGTLEGRCVDEGRESD